MEFVDPESQKLYDKCKYTVKLWEYKFKKKHNRIPSKLDIKEASNDVRYAYKKYFELKSSILEQSFRGIEGFDEDEEDDSSQVTVNQETNDGISVTNKESEENSVIKKESEENKEVEISEKVWGSHLNNPKVEDKPQETTPQNLNLSITKKLFCGSKFSKRNPRKSLSLSQKNKNDENKLTSSQPSTSFASFTSEEAINLLRNEILDQPFKSVNHIEGSLSQPLNVVKTFLDQNLPIRQLKSVDEGWLKRVENVTKTSQEKSDLISATASSIDYNTANSMTLDYDSEDIIENSDEETTSSQQFHIAKKRKIDNPINISQNNNDIANETIDSSSIIATSKSDESNSNIQNVSKLNELNTNKPDENLIKLDKTSTLIQSNVTVEETNIENKDLGNKNITVTKTNSKTKINKEDSVTKPIKISKKGGVKPTKNKTQKISSNSPPQQISQRRSSRKTKLKVNLQEFSSDEDPFHTDEDSDFSIEDKTDKLLEPDEEITPKTNLRSKKEINKNEPAKNSKKDKSTVGGKKQKKAQKEDQDEDENQHYDLEFSIKPRLVAPRFSSLKNVLSESTVLKNKSKSTSSDNMKDKKQQAKEKLEEKAAKGNLNDNFVRINIKKKVFVRGKRGLNFKKYKKNLWKKAKALSGPDMDMGGCDGGMLTCFNCGQIGHFAQNCKVKGDSLLSKGVEDEPDCPFPTLEEASKMAQEGNLNIRKSKMALKEIQASERDSNDKKSDNDNDENNDNNENNDDPFDDDCDTAELLLETLKLEEHVKKLDVQMYMDTVTIVKPYYQLNEGDTVIVGANKSLATKPSQWITVYNITRDAVYKLLKILKTLSQEEVNNLPLDSRILLSTTDAPINIRKVPPDTPSEVFKVLNQFGHSSFRPGQEQAIMRILSGKSTLVTLSTGSGKSLCYQLPAYMYSQREPCISLIISPLVSLMDDQIMGIAKFMKAACLHSNQTAAQRKKILEAISLGELSILLVSPEAVVSGEKQKGFGSFLRKLPPIAFACIDEAHCVSQWSHNFRPSYLLICRVLRENLGVKTILGLTATATKATQLSIINHLMIPDGERGVISDIPLPDNLELSVSKDSNRDYALLSMLLSDKYKNCNSIIVYCTRRQECERIAAFLRTSLKSEKPIVETTSKKRKRVFLQAEPYHAGMSASRRKSVQKAFMSGELRIVVATVAFGMGINKADIRAVIHYNMPSSFESYVQEVGRAGRDGLKAQCHVFLDSRGGDENELRRHIHANSIDRPTIRKLLKKIFIPCSCKDKCPKHEVAFSIESTVQELDIPEENISTLLCYLELHEKKYIELLSPAYTVCKVISYSGPLQIRKIAKECPPLAMALALYKNDKDANLLEFPIIDVAAAMGWESGVCKHKLKNLEWTAENNVPKRSSISVQFLDLGFRLLAPGNLQNEELDETLDNLYTRVVDQEKTALLQLNAIHQTLLKSAKLTYQACSTQTENKDNEDDDNNIKSKVREYFNLPDPLKLVPEITYAKFNEEQLISDIHALIFMYRDNNFTGRAIARIFQGIPSPNYPPVIWGRCKFWRKHLDVDFHAIVRIAVKEIIKLK